MKINNLKINKKVCFIGSIENTNPMFNLLFLFSLQKKHVSNTLNSFKRHFTRIQVIGCLFNFSQSLFKMFYKLELKQISTRIFWLR
jgi:hypothetical protein